MSFLSFELCAYFVIFVYVNFVVVKILAVNSVIFDNNKAAWLANFSFSICILSSSSRTELVSVLCYDLFVDQSRSCGGSN